ncbi:hypothetical protein AQS8620_02611 [Aquimixticola soesokkakensis]|uniref:Transglycosylase SLT domain-containing protein n=1 Tax=Aquimixticola soesokkakensis TaxID=1519096 RepID=A0A1Y5T9Y3_9RHOB|nr:hypothetical protein [Aquimixticola soesokkakensis]SLN58960.1 hypothetical protein AQS8620_02611 [Aquimixticola soesokkakensis]
MRDMMGQAPQGLPARPWRVAPTHTRRVAPTRPWRVAPCLRLALALVLCPVVPALLGQPAHAQSTFVPLPGTTSLPRQIAPLLGSTQGALIGGRGAGGALLAPGEPLQPVAESDIVTATTPMPADIAPDRLDAALAAFATAQGDAPRPGGTHWVPATLNWRQMERIERSAPRADRGNTLPVLSHTGNYQTRLLDIIAAAEATTAGFDTIHTKAKVLPRKKPTQLTLGEVFAWIERTPKQPHAIGRYQFIPKTLAYLVEAEGIGPNERFSPEMQHRLAWRLIEDAGYRDFADGKVGNDAFMDRLAKIWAGLPLKNGKSVYHGYAGNRATIKRDWFAREFAAIFGPDGGISPGATTAASEQNDPMLSQGLAADAPFSSIPPRGIPLTPIGPPAGLRRSL